MGQLVLAPILPLYAIRAAHEPTTAVDGPSSSVAHDPQNDMLAIPTVRT